MERKPQSLVELAEIGEQYLTVHNKKLSSREFNSKMSACVSRSEVKNTDFATTGNIKCFNCKKSGHRQASVFCVCKDEGKRNSCYRC